MIDEALRSLLNKKVKTYNRVSFIKDDPVSVPHLFSGKQDIEIAGFFAAIFAWGNRVIIINKSRELMRLMDDAPHSFIQHHTNKDLKSLLHFKHRTFNSDDLLFLVEALKNIYAAHSSLEKAFFPKKNMTVEEGLNCFKKTIFQWEHLSRTRKHISSPLQKSSCKRLNMFLRWMVRRDNSGVDFGIWKSISPAQLICPLDVHVIRVAKKLNLLSRTQPDWQAAVELTGQLRLLDQADPVKYDFALFGLGVYEKF